MMSSETAESRYEAEHEGGSLPLVILFPLGVVCLTTLAQPWATSSIWIYLPLLAATSFAFLCYTSCFHETAHQTLSDSERFSVIVGRILGTLMFTPYTTYRESHIRHHAYLNKPADFELWPYSDPNASIWFRRLFVWFDLLCGFIASPIVYGRTFLHKDSPIKRQEIRRAIKLEYVVIVVFWSLTFAVIAWQNWWFQFLTIWILPHWVAGIMQTGRKLTEHLGMSSYDPLMGTRTVVGTNWFTRFCTWMNFDIFVHGPHHRHPRLGHAKLIGKMQEYSEAVNAQFPRYPTYRKATLAMIPYLFLNPGVGVNAGASNPDAERKENVEEFVSDVSREILSDRDLETTV